MPRLLNTDIAKTTARLQELTELLGSIGLRPKDVRRLTLKMPLLMLLNPITTATKLAYLKVIVVIGGGRAEAVHSSRAVHAAVSQQP